MNKDQRKYLIDQVASTLREQTDEVEKERPKQPSLNNYLVAAFLDNSIEFQDLPPLKEKIREMVLKMGHNDTLIEEKDGNDYWGMGRSRQKGERKNFIKVIAEDLFVIPEAYKVALKEYQEKTDDIEKRITQLRAQAKTITMKVQIGSAESLNKLVTEVDNLADLSIMNSKFLLGNGE